MAITLVGGAPGAAAHANNGNITPALPSGTQAGDLLVCATVIASVAATAQSPGTPTDFTSQINHLHTGVAEVRLAIFTKLAVGSDANPTVTYSGGTAQDSVFGQCAAFRGVDQTTPVPEVGTALNGVSQANVGAIPGITGAAGNAILVVGGKRDDWTSVDTLTTDGLSWAEIGEPDNVTGDDCGLVWDYVVLGAGATISNATFTVTGGANARAVGVMLEIAAAAAGGGQPPRSMHQFRQRAA